MHPYPPHHNSVGATHVLPFGVINISGLLQVSFESYLKNKFLKSVAVCAKGGVGCIIVIVDSHHVTDKSSYNVTW